MSFALSSALQTAIYAALSSDDALAALVGPAIYDDVPPGDVPDLYVRLGAETVRDASDGTGTGAEHTLVVTVCSSRPGFGPAKAAAGAVSDALHDADLVMARGRLIALRFERARVRRIEAGNARQIDLRFRARVADDVPQT